MYKVKNLIAKFEESKLNMPQENLNGLIKYGIVNPERTYQWKSRSQKANSSTPTLQRWLRNNCRLNNKRTRECSGSNIKFAYDRKNNTVNIVSTIPQKSEVFVPHDSE